MRTVLVARIQSASQQCIILRDFVDELRHASKTAIHADARRHAMVDLAIINRRANNMDISISEMRDELIRTYGG